VETTSQSTDQRAQAALFNMATPPAGTKSRWLIERIPTDPPPGGPINDLKRILILSSEFPPGPGGIGTHAYQLAKHLSAAGIKVKVLTPQDYTDPSEVANFNIQHAFEISTLPAHRSTIIQWINRLKAFTKTTCTFDPQIVIASGSRAIWLSANLLPIRNYCLVVVAHGTEFGSQSGLTAIITRVSANRAHGIICVSAYTRDAMRKLGVVKPTDFIIHNGADHQTFYPLPETEVVEFRLKAGVADKFVLLTVGNVSKRKGQEVIIGALPKILHSKPNVIYWMAGLPQEQTSLKQLAEGLGVSHAVRFWGRVDMDQLRSLYNACDLFVMTSRQLADGDFEGYGIAVLEAALCGKPALVSDNSGLAEAVKDGITGIIVPQNDPAATSEGILSLADAPETLMTLGQQAQLNAITHQTWDQVVDRYRVVLEKIYHEFKGDAQ
jgi:phosphatidyl-myo-inositol dimannoside synthase